MFKKLFYTNPELVKIVCRFDFRLFTIQFGVVV